MDKEMFDNVKYEKAKAMARFNMFQRMKKLLQIFELLVLVLLISWSTNKIPSMAKFSGKIFTELKVYLENSLFVFVIVNLIMLALFVLRKPNETVVDSSVEDLYDEYEKLSDNSEKTIIIPESLKLPEAEEDVVVVEKEMQTVVHDDQCDAVEPAVAEAAKKIAEAAKKIRRFERTQSARLKREIGVRTKKELRRSETDNRLVVRDGGDGGDGGRGRKTVDHLSNEEFKLAVDDFINKHTVFFKQQKMAEFKFN